MDPHQATVDAIAVYLVETLGASQPVKWYRRAFIKFGRMANVHGCSLAAVGMATSDVVVLAIARIAQYMRDPTRARGMLDQITTELHNEALHYGVDNPPPPDMTPLRQPQFDSPSPRQPPPQPRPADDSRQHSSGSPEQTIIPPPQGSPTQSIDRLYDILVSREVTSAPTVNSHRLPVDDDLVEHTAILSLAPCYRWRRNDPNAAEIKRSLRATIEAYKLASADKLSPKDTAELLAQRLNDSGTSLTIEQTATIQAIVKCGGPNALWYLSEFFVAARRTLGPSALTRLQKARTIPTDSNTTGLKEGCYGIPTFTAERRNPSPPRPKPHPKDATPTPTKKDDVHSAKKKCAFCHKDVTGSYKEHNRTCAKKPAGF